MRKKLMDDFDVTFQNQGVVVKCVTCGSLSGELRNQNQVKEWASNHKKSHKERKKVARSESTEYGEILDQLVRAAEKAIKTKELSDRNKIKDLARSLFLASYSQKVSPTWRYSPSKD